MKRYGKQVSEKAGLEPGVLIHIGKKRLAHTKLHLIDYDAQGVVEKTFDEVEASLAFKDTPTVTWIDVQGLQDTAIIEKIGTYFHIHPLLLEDILTTGQRPKMEDYGESIFIVLTMFSLGDEEEILYEQVSIIIGPRYVISFQEGEKDIFGPIRERIHSAHGVIRKMGSDYLAYAMLDSIVDNVFVVLEKLETDIEAAEEYVLANPDNSAIQTIHDLKNEALFLRKNLWPLREMVSQLQGSESSLIQPYMDRYLKDLYDHTIQVIETVGTYWEIISEIRDSYLSSLSNRMNEVMKTLTIFATIFIPLTFIVGIYGMNFDYMPELRWQAGYPALMAGMAGLVIGMLIYFKRKNWL
jgi:magnesium transporter